MYSSGITARDLIASIKAEADIAIAIPDTSYLMWLNSIEQLLWSEVIQDERIAVVDVSDGGIDLLEISPDVSESPVHFDDVDTIYSGINELTKIAPSLFHVMSGGAEGYYCKNTGSKLWIYDPFHAESVLVVYYAKPKLKTIQAEQISTEPVAVPAEFVEVIAAKLRGEAYKLANEDGQAAKWLADFNANMENFKVWISGKKAAFGLNPAGA